MLLGLAGFYANGLDAVLPSATLPPSSWEECEMVGGCGRLCCAQDRKPGMAHGSWRVLNGYFPLPYPSSHRLRSR